MKPWEKRQKHHSDIKEVFSKHGLWKNGCLMGNKPQCFKELKEKGHNSLDFNQCNCSKEL